jgi:hypothetical protein
MRFLQSKEDDLPGLSTWRPRAQIYLGCDISVVLTLAEIRFGAEQWLDVSGSETGEGSKLWLVFVRKDERFTGLEEDPSCGRENGGLRRQRPGMS